MLAAGALGAVGVDPQVVVQDLDLGVLGKERRHDHGREGSVAAVRLVERALANEPVLPALRFQDPVGVFAADREGRGLEACLFPGARLEQVDLEAAVRAPALVHPQHHLCPVLGVRPAGARLQRHDSIAGVVLAVEQRGFLETVELRAQRAEPGDDLTFHLAAVHLGELARVVVVADQVAVALELA